MRALLISVLVSGIACAHAPVMRYTGPELLPAVETQPLPDAPDKTPIPTELDWVLALQAGETAPKAGILFSPEKTARAKLWQVGYQQIRGMYEADRTYWSQIRAFYDVRLKQANLEIDRLQPSWWDTHKGELGFVSGMVIGAAACISIVYGVNQVQGN